jgi:hypothetical protein
MGTHGSSALFRIEGLGNQTALAGPELVKLGDEGLKRQGHEGI